jgi:hypothetical protein
MSTLVRSARIRQKRERGQSIVEFAIALPLLMLFIFSVIQISLVLVTYYSETRMARETARWLAIRAGTMTDLQVAQHVQDTMLPGLVGGSPTLVTTGTSSVDTVYTVGNMTVQFTPCLPSSGVCQHTKRAPGATLSVQLTYNASHLFFLPTEFRIGSVVTRLPTSVPPYKVSVMVE